MRLELDGEPIHTRAHSVLVRRRPDGRLDARGSLLDLRTRGFLPVGGDLQGMGIIHHMELGWVIDPARGRVEHWQPAQPTVAFEPSPETAGESCRDPIARLAGIGATPLGADVSVRVRDAAGGPRGCSHLVTLALFMDAAVRAGLARHEGASDARPLFRRDLVVDAHEVADGDLAVGVRQADLDWSPAAAEALAPDRFARHHELAARIDVELWPGTLRRARGAERVRDAERFVGVAWSDRTLLLGGLAGMGLVRGATADIVSRLGDAPDAIPWRDALVMLAPSLVQCRSAHPDTWHEKVRATPHHPGLTALPDSCWMWRRGGALERLRETHGAGKGGR